MTTSNPAAVVERTTVVLAVALTCVGGLLWGARGTLATGAGGILACLNIYVMSRLAGRAVDRARAGDTTRASLFGAGMIAKMMVLVGLCWLAVGVVHLSVPAFALGLSALVLSATGAGLWLALRPVQEPVPSQEVL
jgi:hypothetical protein